MGHGAGEGIDDGLVDLHVLPLDDKLHLLAQLPGHIAHDPGQLLEEALAGLHAQAHDGVLDVVDGEIHLPGDAGHVLVFRTETAHGRGEAIAQENEFSHLVHDRIQAHGIDAQGGLGGLGGGDGSGLGGRRYGGRCGCGIRRHDAMQLWRGITGRADGIQERVRRRITA